MKITKEKYQNIVKMLKSPDVANQMVALTIINELSFTENITQILLLKKHSTATNNQWVEHAPDIFTDLSNIKDLDTSKHLTYKQVLKALTTMKVSAEGFEFYMNDFSDYLLNQIQAMGYDYIEDIQITIKAKDDDQNRESSESL